MHPINDVDALLLLATALSSKRRPAELVEIVSASELIAREIPPASKLAESFQRLTTHGLIAAADGGFLLSEAAQDMVRNEPKKAETAERIFLIKNKLSAYAGKPKHEAVALGEAEIEAAIDAHLAAVKASRKNVMVPKPLPAAEQKPGLRQRKPLPPRGRRK